MLGGRVTALAVAAMCVVVGAATAHASYRGQTVAVRARARAGQPRGAAEALERTVTRALEGPAGMRVVERDRATWLVRATITRFHRGQDGVLSCTVSLVFEDGRTGAMRMVLTGKASARGPAAPRLALEGAVRGAMRPLAPSLLAMR